MPISHNLVEAEKALKNLNNIFYLLKDFREKRKYSKKEITEATRNDLEKILPVLTKNIAKQKFNSENIIKEMEDCEQLISNCLKDNNSNAKGDLSKLNSEFKI